MSALLPDGPEEYLGYRNHPRQFSACLHDPVSTRVSGWRPQNGIKGSFEPHGIRRAAGGPHLGRQFNKG
jgi:hypothetical protein